MTPQDQAYQTYDFGPGVTVDESDGWLSDSSSLEVSRNVYVRFDDDDEDAPTTRVSFTVKLTEDRQAVEDAWATTSSGNELGFYPEKKRSPRP